MALPPPLSEETVEESLHTLDQGRLEETIRIADHRYWEADDSGISDRLFDRLVLRLHEIAPRSIVLKGIGFMKHRKNWGGTVKHGRPMLSLQKSYSVDEVIKWAGNTGNTFTVMPKVDGVALVLRYDVKGVFRRAITRGDGRKGEDVTFAVGRLACIPSRLPASKCPAEIRGELYFPKKAFKQYSDRFTAARNAAAGYLKNRQGTEVLPLKFLPYAAQLAHTPDRHFDVVGEVATLFKIKSFCAKAKCDGGQLAGLLRLYPDIPKAWPFEADGLVVRLNKNSLYEEAGNTAHHPRGAMALKFSDPPAETELEDVVWETSRSGIVTPVAVFAPVEVGGATLSRATLHNVSRVEELKLVIGCKLEVTRRGGVIPQIERAFERPTGRGVRIPSKCPSCSGPVDQHDADGKFLFCTQFQKCPAVQVGSIVHFASTLGIKGFGPEIVTKLHEAEFLPDMFSVYNPELPPYWEEIIGQKTALNLLAEVEAHKKIPLETFLCALGITSLGAQTARIIAAEFKTLGNVLSPKSDFCSIKGIGPITGALIKQGLGIVNPEIAIWLAFYGPDIVSFAKKKRKRGYIGKPPEEHVLAGKSVLFTGPLSIPRAQAEAAVEKCGATVTMFPTKGLGVLVAADPHSYSRKIRKVREFNASGSFITIWSEKEFRLNVPTAYSDET